MKAGTWTPNGSVISNTTEYETPRVIELGGVVELTNGNTDQDTADMNQYYY